jgi:3-hydroxymyristoyl/3-hydroxydecanoyl-(acyl carrier protein) dehydratase
LHIQPSQQKRLVNRLNALCNQTIVTTHSPIVAAMFPAPDTLFIETEIIRMRGSIGQTRCRCLVNGEVVSEAELKFALLDR